MKEHALSYEGNQWEINITSKLASQSCDGLTEWSHGIKQCK